MSLDYIRTRYKVPAYSQQRVRYTGDRKPKIGRIWRGENGRLLVKFNKEKHVKRLHPTWEVEYLKPWPKHCLEQSQ
jgi:hypothetical protein